MLTVAEKDIQSERESDSDEDNGEEQVLLSDSDQVILFPKKSLTEQGNVFEGEIFSAVAHRRKCAIKFPRSSDQAVRELGALRILSCKSHVISLLTSGTYQDSICEHSYIVLEKCDKYNLRQHLLHRKQTLPVFDVSWAFNFCRQIIDGMKFVHDKLIIHKDLKPSNILLTLDLENIKIADFGLSQELKTTSSMVYCPNMFGTLGFRPPESFGGSFVSLKSDIFSLGSLLYFLLSNGESPFGDMEELWDHNTKNALIDVSGLKVTNPVASEHIIKLMLSHGRQRRPSIWEIASHPCWREIESVCDFDYGEQVEKNDIEICSESSDDSADDDELDNGTRLFIQAFARWEATKNASHNEPDDNQNISIDLFPVQISNSEIDVQELISHGIYTDYYVGIWKNERVCIQQAFPHDPNSKIFFERKLNALTDLKHNNIVRLLATTTDIPRSLVLEITDYKNLRYHLKYNKEAITAKDRWNYLLQISEGMRYIASKNYIHGWLSTSSVLIQQGGVLKITRFVLAHRAGEKIEDWENLILEYITAPEVLSSGMFSEKSDVWSFGFVLHDIFDVTNAILFEHVDLTRRVLARPLDCPEIAYQKMKECWQSEAENRPRFSELKAFFKDLVHTR